MKFNSQISTSRSQSEKLLSLGLKKETADCGIYYSELAGCDRVFAKIEFEFEAYEIPAWSLHRLWELDRIHDITLDSEDEIATLYDAVIDNIEQEIKAGKFNKEYLV